MPTFPENPGKNSRSDFDATIAVRLWYFSLMSLRAKVIALVALVLLASLGGYILTALGNARSDLAAELGAARTGGVQIVRSAFEDLPRSDHAPQDLQQLVATFDGNRHLKASLLDQNRHELLTSAVAMPNKPAPHWFAAAIDPHLNAISIVVPLNGSTSLVLQPEPASDIAAIWSDSSAAAGLFAVAALVCLGLIYGVIGSALAPLADLSRGFAAIGAGGYDERVREKGSPELLSLQRGFNAMAAKLADIDAHNRRLEAQLLTIQDEERAEIARDLHDEIGPHLFAVALDAEMIGRSAGAGNFNLISEQVRSIQSAVSYMQRQVRELIARLRPTRAAELGVEAAISDLVAFWQARQPEVAFTTQLAGADTFVAEPLRDVIYRVAQEGVANALRHADTTQVAIEILQTTNGILTRVSNRGKARNVERRAGGLGLAGMHERVHAAAGTLKIERSDQGWTITARFGVKTEGIAA